MTRKRRETAQERQAFEEALDRYAIAIAKWAMRVPGRDDRGDSRDAVIATLHEHLAAERQSSVLGDSGVPASGVRVCEAGEYEKAAVTLVEAIDQQHGDACGVYMIYEPDANDHLCNCGKIAGVRKARLAYEAAHDALAAVGEGK